MWSLRVGVCGGAVLAFAGLVGICWAGFSSSSVMGALPRVGDCFPHPRREEGAGLSIVAVELSLVALWQGNAGSLPGVAGAMPLHLSVGNVPTRIALSAVWGYNQFPRLQGLWPSR